MGKWVHRLSEINKAENHGICDTCGPVTLYANGRGGFRCGGVNARTIVRKHKHRLTEIDLKQSTAVCAECGPVRIRSRGNGWRCSIGAAKWSRNVLNDSAKSVMLEAQNKRCAICKCKLTMRKAHTDHDHETGKTRGILCAGCNIGLGHFKDNPKFLRSAARYLTR